ncbi:MAG: thioredoxin [Verrucomicrobia bacterium]|nr:thioredoxin [Verrucomicrobiota bacterium]
MSQITELTEETFEQEVRQAGLPVLVDFYAPWCGPCKMLAPVLDKLAGDYADRVKIVKVNVDEAPGLAADFGITGVPTLMVFRGAQLLDSFVGVPSPRDLKASLDRAATGVPAAHAAAA